MPDHGENYERMRGAEGEEIGSLGPDCGHHCGVITVGVSHKMERHCPCRECHADDSVVAEVPTQFTMGQGGMDPRGIT